MYSMPMGIDAHQRVADLMNSKGKETNDLHWDHMAEMLCEILLNDRLPQDVRHYATTINDCLYSFWMKDPFLVTQAIDILSALRDFQMEDALDTEDHELFYRVNGVDLKPPRVAKLCDEIYERRQASQRFNFVPQLDFEAVSRAMAAGDADVMKNLVKYGVSYDSQVWKEGKYFQRICAMMMHNKSCSNSHQHRMLSWIAETTVKRIYRRRNPTYNYRKLLKVLPGMKRVLLIRGIVQIIARQEELKNDAKKMKLEPFLYLVDCFKLFYETNTEPFLSLQELRAYFRQDVPELKIFTAAKIEELFLHYFKEWPETYEPRSLKHLCRCQIRYEVRKNSELLPIKARSLRLPRILLRYILADKTVKLQKDEDLLARIKPFRLSYLHLSPSLFGPVPPPSETYTISSDDDS